MRWCARARVGVHCVCVGRLVSRDSPLTRRAGSCETNDRLGIVDGGSFYLHLQESEEVRPICRTDRDLGQHHAFFGQRFYKYDDTECEGNRYITDEEL